MTAVMLIVIIYLQYNKQHIIPLEEVKLESLADEGRKYIVILFNIFVCNKIFAFTLSFRVL